MKEAEAKIDVFNFDVYEMESYMENRSPKNKRRQIAIVMSRVILEGTSMESSPILLT